MGKRSKKSQGPVKKKNQPLPTQFTCLFCNHEKSILIKLLEKEGVGQLNCRVCGQSYQTSINYLSHPVDVYSDWVDACDAVAKQGGEALGAQQSATAGRATRRGDGVTEDGDIEDLIDDRGVEREPSADAPAVIGDEDDDY